MGYHTKKIEKGILGEYSKIKEEFEEFQDAFSQNNPIMELIELSDLIGAIEAYALKNHNINIHDLVKMMEATKSAFKDGTRQ